LQSAKQELLEEAGLKAVQWTKIGIFFIGASHEDVLVNVFVAQNLTVTNPYLLSYGNSDEDIKK
jgi:8-oxo-dGTP pyrophosphatase MutT (NUDIX family)